LQASVTSLFGLIQIQSIGITSIPIVVTASVFYGFHILVYLSPIITIIISAMLMFEQNSIMRAGSYIRNYIEPNLKDSKELGWENFLQDTNNRIAEKSFRLSVVLVYSLYWLVGTILSYWELYTNGKLFIANILSVLYVGSFFFCIYYYWNHFRINVYLENENNSN
jgi:positive regulator of sigma E activity